MQSYLGRRRLRTLMDTLGVRLLLAALSLGWFVGLWGLTVPALLAGAALGILAQQALSRYRQRSVCRREEMLRRRLGGELMLERMLMSPVRQAHFQAALLLGEKYPLVMERVTDAGVLCRSEDDAVLVACVAIPEKAEAGLAQLAGIRREAALAGAERCVACVTGRCEARSESWAGEGPVPLRVIGRDELLELAGRVCPATDEQLVALGQRKKRPDPAALLRLALRRDKAKTYLTYGLLLLVMGIVTGLGYYAAPGLVCLALAALSRIRRRSPEQL